MRGNLSQIIKSTLPIIDFFRIFAFSNLRIMKLRNNVFSIEVAEHGAELISLQKDGFEYIWPALPEFWKRHAPILFPIVGKVFDGTYRVQGKEYHLPQHGFARDSEFEVVETLENQVSLRLAASEATLRDYPYPFVLTATYILEDNTLRCIWKIDNPSDETIYFQIGAHPAFNYPHFEAEDVLHGYLEFRREDEPTDVLTIALLGESGCVLPETECLLLPESRLPLTQHIFDRGALVLEDCQADKVTLFDKLRHPLLAVSFDAPVLGIWSPTNAPFCCIEPWYGRADSEGFTGPIEQRRHIQQLPAQGTFTFEYDITLLR